MTGAVERGADRGRPCRPSSRSAPRCRHRPRRGSPRPGRGSRAWRRCPPSPSRRIAAVAVAGVLAAADVGDEQQIGNALRAAGAAPAGRCRPPRSSREPTSSFVGRAARRGCTAGMPSGLDPIHLAIERLVHREMERRRASSRSRARSGCRAPRKCGWMRSAADSSCSRTSRRRASVRRRRRGRSMGEGVTRED